MRACVCVHVCVCVCACVCVCVNYNLDLYFLYSQSALHCAFMLVSIQHNECLHSKHCSTTGYVKSDHLAPKNVICIHPCAHMSQALKKTTTGAQPVADIVQPAATSEHLMSVGTDDETHRETSTRQKPSVALPPLKQHTQMTAPKSDIDLEVQAGQLDGMKNVGQTKNTSRLLNHKGSGNKGFLPQID